MSATFVQKLKNYVQLPKLTADERATFEQIRQQIVNNPDKLKQIVEKNNPIMGNYYDCAYTLESSIKFIAAQGTYVQGIALPFEPMFAACPNTAYEAYVMMPDGQYINLSNTKRAKLLLKTAKRTAKKNKGNNIIDIPDFNGISKFINQFIAQYDKEKR